jgi:hypothetical protein
MAETISEIIDKINEELQERLLKLRSLNSSNYSETEEVIHILYHRIEALENKAKEKAGNEEYFDQIEDREFKNEFIVGFVVLTQSVFDNRNELIDELEKLMSSLDRERRQFFFFDIYKLYLDCCIHEMLDTLTADDIELLEDFFCPGSNNYPQSLMDRKQYYQRVMEKVRYIADIAKKEEFTPPPSPAYVDQFDVIGLIGMEDLMGDLQEKRELALAIELSLSETGHVLGKRGRPKEMGQEPWPKRLKTDNPPGTLASRTADFSSFSSAHTMDASSAAAAHQADAQGWGRGQ